MSQDDATIVTPPRGIPKEFKSRLVILELVLLVLLIATGAWLWWANRVETVLDYPEQTVLNRLVGLSEPALTYDEAVRVRATKCVLGDEEIPLTGVASWVSVAPSGTVVEIDEQGTWTAEPGCTDYQFLNAVPPDVRLQTDELLRITGNECVKWRLSGVETPVDPRYAPAAWMTEDFWLCPTPPTPRE